MADENLLEKKSFYFFSTLLFSQFSLLSRAQNFDEQKNNRTINRIFGINFANSLPFFYICTPFTGSKLCAKHS
jgi:hypothetical protein